MTQVEKKAQPYRPSIPISENGAVRKSTLELHGTATDPHYGLLSSVGFIPWPRWATTIPLHKTPPFKPIMHLYSRLCQTHFSPSDILLLTQSTFSSVSQAGRFPTHSPLYIRLTNRLSFIPSTCLLYT